MSNSYFKFKQFTIQQDLCAMKVCTDACLFGAWVSNKIENNGVTNILDIGAGTGLLSLMIAQKTNATIHAIEIDEAAAKQAQENFNASPWSNRFTVFNNAVQRFKAEEEYDLILSNPPFFENDLKSHDNLRNVALHSQQLTSEELLNSIKRLLKPGGSFALLLPYHRSLHYEKLAKKEGFNLLERISVKQTEKHPFFRSILLFSNNEQTPLETAMTIKIDGVYSLEFISLLKDYYLYL